MTWKEQRTASKEILVSHFSTHFRPSCRYCLLSTHASAFGLEGGAFKAAPPPLPHAPLPLEGSGRIEILRLLRLSGNQKKSPELICYTQLFSLLAAAQKLCRCFTGNVSPCQYFFSTWIFWRHREMDSYRLIYFNIEKSVLFMIAN